MSQQTARRPESPGDRLAIVRGKRSQVAFAAELGISRSSLQHYEAGTRKMDTDVLAQLRVLLGVDPLWLLTGEGRGPVTPDESALLEAFKKATDDGQHHLLCAAKWIPRRSHG